MNYLKKKRDRNRKKVCKFNHLFIYFITILFLDMNTKKKSYARFGSRDIMWKIKSLHNNLTNNSVSDPKANCNPSNNWAGAQCSFNCEIINASRSDASSAAFGPQ